MRSPWSSSSSSPDTASSNGTQVPNKILLTTADRAQGNERSVVVVFLAVKTKASGAGFLCDENRMNFISTRAADFFIVIGDIDVARKRPSEKVKQSSGRALDNNKLPQWTEFFCRHRRVANRAETKLPRQIGAR